MKKEKQIKNKIRQFRPDAEVEKFLSNLEKNHCNISEFINSALRHEIGLESPLDTAIKNFKKELNQGDKNE